METVLTASLTFATMLAAAIWLRGEWRRQDVEHLSESLERAEKRADRHWEAMLGSARRVVECVEIARRTAEEALSSLPDRPRRQAEIDDLRPRLEAERGASAGLSYGVDSLRAEREELIRKLHAQEKRSDELYLSLESAKVENGCLSSKVSELQNLLKLNEARVLQTSAHLEAARKVLNRP